MVALALLAHLAVAAPVGTADVAEAKRLYQQGLRDYQDGRFELAIQEFLSSDLLRPSAALAYNVAEVYEKLGDNERAVVYLRRYLERAPAASNRGAVEATIKNLLAQPGGSVVVVPSSPPLTDVGPGGAQPGTSGAVDKSQAEAAPRKGHAVGIALTVTGIVAAGFAIAGLGEVISYGGLSSRVQNGGYSGTWSNVAGSRSNAQNWGTVGIVCAVIAVGAGIGAAVTW